MTDRLECPDCGGSGQHTYGPLRVRCQFCQGLGYVGDDNEPAEEAELSPSTDYTPVWEQLGAREMPGCQVCMGTGQVIGLGGDVGGGAPSKLVTSPCPACSQA